MFFFFSSRRRHTRCSRDWSSDVCSSDLPALPDTNEFTLKPYHTRFTPDYVARPTIGYERDNFGRGFFGGTAIVLSDMLGNHTLAFAGAVNGRLVEARSEERRVGKEGRSRWAP